MRTLRRIDLASLKMMFAIALAAMVVRAMVPSGWMIMADPETGRPSIQLCSGKMFVPAAADEPADPEHAAHGDHAGHHGHDMHGGAHDQHAAHKSEPATPVSDDGEHDHGIAEVPCPFALSSLVGLAGDPLLALEPHIPASIDRAVPPVRGPPAARVIHAPLPARGPPSFA
ncbi:MAG: hypothetical protein RLN72_08310 [Henriciella sp.]